MYRGLIGICSILLNDLDSAIAEGGLRPVSFLEQLLRLLGSPAARPLRKALQRARVVPRRFAFLSAAIVERPDSWLRDAAALDMSELLCESLPHLSNQSYLQLFRTAMEHPLRAEVLAAHTVNQIISRLLELGEWDLTVTIVEELYRTNTTISRTTMNKLLNRASRAEPQYFLAIYDLFQRMKHSPNIVTIGIILFWNATRPTATIDIQGTANVGTSYRTLRELYATGISGSLCIPPTSLGGTRSRRHFYPLASLTLPEIHAKLRTRSCSLADLVQVFCSPQCLQHQDFVINAVLELVDAPFPIDKELHEAAKQRDYTRAYMLMSEGLVVEALKQHRVQLAIDTATYALAAGSGQLSLDTITKLILRALKEDLVLEAVSLAENCLAVAPDAIITGPTLVHIVRRAFDSGLQGACLNLLTKMGEQQAHLPPELLIQANLLILEEPDIFIKESLEKLARRSPSALDKALQCLSVRNRHAIALELFHKIKRKSPTMVHPVHYGRALVAAASLNSPSKAKLHIYAEFRSRYPSLVRSLELACARGSKMLGAVDKDKGMQFETVPTICGLAVSMSALPNYGLFNRRFLNLFSSVLRPDIEVITKFLSLHLARSEISQNKGSTEGEEPTSWVNFILPWMEHRGVVPTLPIYSRLLQLALRYRSKESIERLMQELNQRKFRLTFSLYKALFKEVTSYRTAKSLFGSAEEAHVGLGPEQYEITARLAVKEGFYEDACSYLETLHDRPHQGGKERNAISSLVNELLLQSFTKLPLTSFMALLNRVHALGYLAPPSIYAEFIRISVIEHHPMAALSYFNLLCQASHQTSAKSLVPEEWKGFLELLIRRGMVNDAYRVWKVLVLNKSPEFVPSCFASILRGALTPDALACLSPPRALESSGPAQLILDYAICQGSELPPQWVRAVLSNSLATGNVGLARSLHLYLATKSVPGGSFWTLSANPICLTVAGLWANIVSKKEVR